MRIFLSYRSNFWCVILMWLNETDSPLTLNSHSCKRLPTGNYNKTSIWHFACIKPISNPPSVLQLNSRTRLKRWDEFLPLRDKSPTVTFVPDHVSVVARHSARRQNVQTEVTTGLRLWHVWYDAVSQHRHAPVNTQRHPKQSCDRVCRLFPACRPRGQRDLQSSYD